MDDKNNPKKVIYKKAKYYSVGYTPSWNICPTCEKDIGYRPKEDSCWRCGQKLIWK